ncbi:MAG: hypothetical protein ACP5TY_10120, partial [Thermodesulforhabdaceae bacterium]
QNKEIASLRFARNDKIRDCFVASLLAMTQGLAMIYNDVLWGIVFPTSGPPWADNGRGRVIIEQPGKA